ncbi:hypothetical protein DesfrDRAFT_2408 [Solidesulfovibrio fructosivorans JJ]]|uniref:Uncharacterized protein n=1 Tax=Solidesulfovibrio fructosivorans JJ] TaxID=596151 RepID=E1JXQ9_SOLFR|nr:polysialyltransferase family glycosyltransferase [Solidesulfovibrio fructosivorans]EFL50832.1 hypothetical protein DesfrDRAFT_2408 [Solidesulfovibrio fructosivorans JJ]]
MTTIAESKNHVLLLAYTPCNLIMGFAAHHTVAPNAILDVLYCGATDKNELFIRQLADTCPSIASITFLSWERLEKMASSSYPLTARWALPLTKGWLERRAGERLKSVCPTPWYDIVFYPHDAVGQALGLARAAWPMASFVWIGDSFGIFVEKKAHFDLLGLRVVKHPFLREIKPSQATACLPVDQSGYALKDIPLTTISRQTILEILHLIHDSLPELTGYLEDLRHRHAGRTEIFLMTENHAELGYITLKQECAMYADLLVQYASKGSVVYVKPHPGEIFERHEPLITAIAGHCDIVTISPHFRSIPVELMFELILNCELCISMSNPRLSLKFLYNKDVLNPAEPQFVERWFDPASWRLYNDSYLLYENPREALRTWDGQGVLWSGDLPDRV